MLYGRKKDAPKLVSRELYEFLIEDAGIKQDVYLPSIEVLRCNDTENGFIELAIFHLLGEQFYLAWHAAYNDAPLISSHAGMHKFLSDPNNFMRKKNGTKTVLPEGTIHKARAIDPTPQVAMSANSVTVKLLAFSNWKGFYWHAITFKRNPPHKAFHEERQVIVPYRCPVMF